jgi:hypothetical protein
MSIDLAEFAHAVASGALGIVDLTHTLSPEFPAFVLPPEFGQVWGFESEPMSLCRLKGSASISVQAGGLASNVDRRHQAG